MLHKLNFKIKITISLHKNFRNERLKRNTNQENKQTNETNNKQHQKIMIKKSDTLPTQPVFPKDLSQVVYL